MHRLVQDGYGHWFIIPAERLWQWYLWEMDDNAPLEEWMLPLGEPVSYVQFGSYVIG